MSDSRPPQTPTPVVPKDPLESRLEEREKHKFLLAKTYFDCREYDRCAAVFLPSTLPKGAVNTSSPTSKTKSPAKGKAKVGAPAQAKSSARWMFGLSQKSLFLALYAKYIAGEKRKDEESEMILGPQDGGVTMNKELTGISTVLEEWFAVSPDEGRQPQGWLEYLYGIVLAKGKNEHMAIDWFIRSVNCYPYNWGVWLELSSILNTVEEVSSARDRARRQANLSLLVDLHYFKTSAEHHHIHFPRSRHARTLSVY